MTNPEIKFFIYNCLCQRKSSPCLLNRKTGAAQTISRGYEYKKTTNNHIYTPGDNIIFSLTGNKTNYLAMSTPEIENPDVEKLTDTLGRIIKDIGESAEQVTAFLYGGVYSKVCENLYNQLAMACDKLKIPVSMICGKFRDFQDSLDIGAFHINFWGNKLLTDTNLNKEDLERQLKQYYHDVSFDGVNDNNVTLYDTDVYCKYSPQPNKRR